MSTDTLKPIEVLRPGTFTDMNGRTLTFTPEDLAAIAAGYDPALSEAPLVVGHPKTDAPAYGWVASLRVNDAGRLEVVPGQVDPAFADMVNAGRFKKVSVKLFLPAAANNPKPGAYYLAHVGFLGAAAPAVKGLRDAAFADGDDLVEFSADDLTPIPQPTEIPAMAETAVQQAAELAAKQAQLDAKEAELAAKEARLLAAQAAQRRAELAAFADGLIAEGRLLPKDQAGVVAFLAALPAEQSVEFADADGANISRPAVEWFQTFLKALPKQVEFGEFASSDKQTATTEAAALSAEEQQVCELLGQDPKTFKTGGKA